MGATMHQRLDQTPTPLITAQQHNSNKHNEGSMKQHSTVGLAAIALTALLSSCGVGSSAPEVVIRPNADGTTDIQTLQLSLKTSTYNKSLGTQSQTPAGLRVSYLFQDGVMHTRIDTPKDLVLDGQARIMTFDSKTQRSRILFKDGLQPDPALQDFNPEAITEGGLSASMRMFDPKNPFKKMTVERFQVFARTAAFDVSKESDKRFVARATFTNGKFPHTVAMYFDPEIGTVTRIEDTTVSTLVTQNSVSEIKFATVSGDPQTVIPYEINTDLTITSNQNIPPVELPTNAQTLPNDQAPPLQEGEYIANHFTSAPGSGLVDVNTMHVNQVVQYEDIQVNTVTPDFVTLGGK